jgi:hypothetical protein
MLHPSLDLFLGGLVFGLGFHVAGAVIDFVASVLGRRRV